MIAAEKTAVWKYIAIFVMNVLAVGPTPQIPASDPSNPIQDAYNYANLFSTLTDRALWLFFLFVILSVAWVLDRRKERELNRYREHIVTTLVSVDRLLERVERKLNDD